MVLNECNHLMINMNIHCSSKLIPNSHKRVIIITQIYSQIFDKHIYMNERYRYSTIHLTVFSWSIDTWYAIIYSTFSYQELPLKIDGNLQDSYICKEIYLTCILQVHTIYLFFIFLSTRTRFSPCYRWCSQWCLLSNVKFLKYTLRR